MASYVKNSAILSAYNPQALTSMNKFIRTLLHTQFYNYLSIIHKHFGLLLSKECGTDCMLQKKPLLRISEHGQHAAVLQHFPRFFDNATNCRSFARQAWLRVNPHRHRKEAPNRVLHFNAERWIRTHGRLQRSLVFKTSSKTARTLSGQA